MHLRNHKLKSDSKHLEVTILGGGCFWCTEAVFSALKGVVKVEPGYSGGSLTNPTYEQVSTGETGHAEVVQITFDTGVISFEEILEIFFATHNPTMLNRQGPDVGTQYRSVIFYHNEAQRYAALSAMDALQLSGKLPRPIATEVTEAAPFYRAEEYHQRYFEKRGGFGACGV